VNNFTKAILSMLKIIFLYLKKQKNGINNSSGIEKGKCNQFIKSKELKGEKTNMPIKNKINFIFLSWFEH